MTKTFKFLALSLCAAFALTSCGNGGSAEVTYLPAKLEKNGNWGMVGPDGKMLFEDEFKNQPTPVVNGVFTVEETDGYSVYAAESKPRVIGDLENLKDVGGMSEGVIPVVRKGERISYYDKNGKLKFTLEPVKGKEISSVSGMFFNGRAIISDEDYKCGIIDSNGKVIVEPKYRLIRNYSDGIAIAMVDNDDDSDDSRTYEFLDRSGKASCKIKGYRIYGNFYKGYVSAEKNEHCGLLDKDGEFTKLPSKVKDIYSWNDKYVVYRSDDGCGVMTFDGEVVVRPKYSSVMLLENGKFLCQADNKKIYLVNKDDERKVTFDDLTEILSLSEFVEVNYGLTTKFGLIGGEKDNELYFYNLKGEKICKTEFYELGSGFYRMTGNVYSDYVNLEAAAENFVEPVTASGYANVKLGAPLCEYISGQPKDNRYTDKYYFPDLKSGYKYTITGYAYTNGYVAKEEAVYDTNYYGYYSYRTFSHYNYYWNQDAKTDVIRLTLDIDSYDIFSKAKDAVVTAMKGKGYSVDSNTDAYAVMSNGHTYAVIYASSDTKSAGVFMAMYTESKWGSLHTNVLDTARSRYRALSGSSSDYDDYEYDYPIVEEVAVEEAYEEPEP